SQRQTVFDTPRAVTILCEPSDRTDGPRSVQEAMGVARLATRHFAREKCGNHYAGEVVVAERGVADVRRDQHFVLALPRNHELAVAERSGFERRIDADLVLSFDEGIEHSLAQAEAPAL